MEATRKGGKRANPKRAKAVVEYLAGAGTYTEVAKRNGIPTSTLNAGVRAARATADTKAEGALQSKTYEKTQTGFLMRAYRNMLSRVSGVQSRKAHLYAGKAILPRASFYAWAAKDREFQALWNAWVASGHDRRLTPSVDRVDSNGGYLLENMRWITHSMNSSLGARSKKKMAAETKVIYKILGVKHA